ncbi:hypothetical protein IF1G_11069 [Cordyceps javanica]|uniref:Histidine-specific methyltransferase SAM-dependent domain-containing protein n=1 Tax=Cordyceps javanica TaxID=43265 RepID=A0A545ULH8_9HYPO|nr:hypothetical protein IF1G_11069 [Cordyceps javanica]TQW01777.1 histidine-specific methyltransferase, SAM-dependent domain-containing protein [Cordyceps javanica]
MTFLPQLVKENPFVRWDHFGFPRNPKDIGGSRLEHCYIRNCTDIFEGREHRLDKGIIYYGACVEAAGEILIIELGPGDRKKTKELLYKVSRIDKITLIRYVAVDFNKPILNDVQRLEGISSKIKLYCLWGSFDDALEFIQTWEYGTVKIYVWSFGSTLSNDLESVVSERFRKWSAVGELLIGQDGKQSREEMEAVYKSPAVTELLDYGIRAANQLAGREVFCETCEKLYEFSDSEVRISITRLDGKPIVIFVAFKYDKDKMRDIAQQAGCDISSIWQSESSRITFPVGTNTLNSFGADSDINVDTHAYHSNDPALTHIPSLSP